MWQSLKKVPFFFKKVCSTKRISSRRQVCTEPIGRNPQESGSSPTPIQAERTTTGNRGTTKAFAIRIKDLEDRRPQTRIFFTGVRQKKRPVKDRSIKSCTLDISGQRGGLHGSDGTS